MFNATDRWLWLDSPVTKSIHEEPEGRASAQKHSKCLAMGNSTSKKSRCNSSSSRIRTVDDPLPQINLADYEAACKIDPDVKRFDDKLHTSTREALSSLAAAGPGQGMSFKSRNDVAIPLLEVDNEVVHVILAYKEDVWVNKEFMALVTDFLNTSLEALAFCGVLENCVQQTHDNLELHIQVAINHMPTENKPTQEQCSSVLNELQGFVRAANLFSEVFSKQFLNVYQRYLDMQNKLQVKKKLDKKMLTVPGWKKFSNTYPAVVLHRITADTNAARKVAQDLAEESRKPGRGMGSWLKPLCRRYEQLRVQAAIFEDASRATCVAIQKLSDIKGSVGRLQKETAAITQNIMYGEDRSHDPYSLQVAVEAIRRKQNAFVERMENLRETVSQLPNSIKRARTVVLRRILDYRDTIFREGDHGS